MSFFNTNKNSFNTTVNTLKTDLHSFASIELPKGTNQQRQRKKSVSDTVSNLINNHETDDFGLRILIIKTKQ
jgi:hypothetical protein